MWVGSVSAAGGPAHTQIQGVSVRRSHSGFWSRSRPPGSGMTTKIIHFMVNGRLEQAEFGAECSAADVKGKREGL